MNLHSMSLLLFVATAAAAAHAESFLVLPDALPPNDRLLAKAYLGQVLTNAEPGETVRVLVASDGAYLRPLTVLVIPDGPARGRQNDAGLRKAMSLILPLVQGQPVGPPNGQVVLPEISSVVRNLRTDSKQPPRVTIVGDPVFDAPAYPKRSFRDAHVANEGELFDMNSPFQNGVAQFPKGTEVVWLTQPNWGSHGVHRAAVEDFLRRYFQRWSAELLVLCSDPEVAYRTDSSKYASRVTLDEDAPTGMRHTTLKVEATPERPVTREGRLLEIGRECNGNVLVVDHSPSLVGDAGPDGKFVVLPERRVGFDVLRDKLGVLLHQLPCEWLNVIVFSGQEDTPRADSASPEMLPSTDENRDRLAKWLKSRKIGDGTAMLPAIEKALLWNEVDVITLVSDGEPTGVNEQDRILARLKQVREQRSLRVNVIAVGNLDKSPGLRQRLTYPGIEFLTRVANENGGVLVRW